jgi:solute carrier family 8 (sodium/calcium exchanger)
MAAIEEITCQERCVWVDSASVPGSKEKAQVKIWNPTVGNLTLMALGSSAPEILLNVIEIVGGNCFSGELGPSTIVGSASFNLLMITAVCISAIPAPQIRRIEQTDVFIVTGFLSLFAYFWMLIILNVITPDKVDVSESVLTFFFFPLLVALAFQADKGSLRNFFRSKSDKTAAGTPAQAHAIPPSVRLSSLEQQ